MTTMTTKWAACGVAGALLVSGGFWTGKSLTTSTVTPQVSSGTVGLAGRGEFTFRRDGASQFISYDLPGTLSWRDSYGTWHDSGRPACLIPLSRDQHVTLAVINAAPVANAPGGPVVVWVECPAKPIPRFPIVTPSAEAAPAHEPSASR
jgi:hypothetical protein